MAKLSSLLTLPEMEPQEFCQLHLARSSFDAEEWGYRAKCIRFLAWALDVSPSTVNKWGLSGIDFPKTPRWAKRQLRYLHLLLIQPAA